MWQQLPKNRAKVGIFLMVTHSDAETTESTKTFIHNHWNIEIAYYQNLMNLIKLELNELFVPSFFSIVYLTMITSICIWHLRKEQLNVVFSTLLFTWENWVSDWLTFVLQCYVGKQYVWNRINRTFFSAFHIAIILVQSWNPFCFYFHTINK